MTPSDSKRLSPIEELDNEEEYMIDLLKGKDS
jgi:hypothetical protein